MAPEWQGLGLWSFAELWPIFIFLSETLLIMHTNLIERVLLRQHIQAFIIRGCLQCHCLFDINSSTCACMYCNCPVLFGCSWFSAAPAQHSWYWRWTSAVWQMGLSCIRKIWEYMEMSDAMLVSPFTLGSVILSSSHGGPVQAQLAKVMGEHKLQLCRR